MTKVYHPYHMVNMSPWPLLEGLGILGLIMGLVYLIVSSNAELLLMSMFFIFVVALIWWRDVVRESTYQGYHNSLVLKGLMFGMLLFIVSEILFFFSFFWAFFHSSLSPAVEMGAIWPPFGVFPFNPFQVPLLNTIILLASGISITWSHQCLLSENWKSAKLSLMMTWVLGIYFLFLQCFEYYMASYSISDSVFGSTFFVATGFHGMHVFVGSLFLVVIWIRMLNIHFSSSHFFGFEASAWYWHFVDVVWLFLYSVIYWWGT